MAGYATRTSYAGHPSHSAKADHELTFTSDHPMGADHFSKFTYRLIIITLILVFCAAPECAWIEESR